MYRYSCKNSHIRCKCKVSSHFFLLQSSLMMSLTAMSRSLSWAVTWWGATASNLGPSSRYQLRREQFLHCKLHLGISPFGKPHPRPVGPAGPPSGAGAAAGMQSDPLQAPEQQRSKMFFFLIFLTFFLNSSVKTKVTSAPLSSVKIEKTPETRSKKKKTRSLKTLNPGCLRANTPAVRFSLFNTGLSLQQLQGLICLNHKTKSGIIGIRCYVGRENNLNC